MRRLTTILAAAAAVVALGVSLGAAPAMADGSNPDGFSLCCVR